MIEDELKEAQRQVRYLEDLCAERTKARDEAENALAFIRKHDENSDLAASLFAANAEIKTLQAEIERLHDENATATYTANKLRDIVADIRDAVSDGDDRATQALQEMLDS
jgi:predicted  nucleic acid-binding Zn-ribbon protein